MATNTTNYGWTKPSYEDAADIEVINGTIDNIDEQVKTNETNILLNATNGKTNYINFADKVMSAAGYVYEWTAFDVAQGDYIISFDSDVTGVAVAIELGDTNTPRYTQKGYKTINPVSIGNNHAIVSVAEGAHYVRIYANGAISISSIMLVPKSLYNAGATEYQPYALPNVTITPALQECVDNGVKNYSSITGLSKDTTTAGFASETNFGATIPAGTYVVSYDLTRSDNNKTGVIGFRDVDGAYTDIGYYWTTDSHQIQIVTFSKAVKAINMYVAAGTTCTMSNLMIQTIASYNAGCTTYQPYAMSNADLTAQRKTKRLGRWVTSFTVETRDFGSTDAGGTITKVYIYMGGQNTGLSEYILASQSVSLVSGGAGVSYSISGTTVTFTTTSTCLAYAEKLHFDI